MTKKKYELEFTVDRSKWYQGQGSNESKLLIIKHPDKKQNGKMCCLGFASLACGIPKSRIKGKNDPFDVVSDYDGLKRRKAEDKLKFFFSTKGGITYYSNYYNFTTEDIIDENDSPDTKGLEKERNLKKLFEKIGVKVKFIGKYPK